MPLPNFIISGAPKAGTSSLWSYVRQHPNVFMPDPKEIGFFDYNYDRGTEWYEKKFSGHNGEEAIGEATPWYMCDDRAERVPERMHEVRPNVRLVFILRDPVDRAHSNFWDNFRNGEISFTTTLSEFIRDPESRSHTVIKCGYYYKHFCRFEQYFDRDQFLVLLHEEFCRDPVGTVQRIYNFLEVDPSFVPETSSRVRVTNGFRHLDTLRAINDKLSPLNQIVGGTPLTWLWRRLPHFRYLFWKAGARPPALSDEDRTYLRRLYAESNAKLDEYLDLDLSHWEGVKSEQSFDASAST